MKVRTSRKSQVFSKATLAMIWLPRQAAHGLLGGDQFSPESCAVKVLSGPQSDRDPGAAGPESTWDLEVSGVCAEAMRVLVDALCNHDPGFEKVECVEVVGDLPLDGSKHSVGDDTLWQMLDDFDAYPGAWPDPGFPTEYVAGQKGAIVRLQFDRDVTKADVDEAAYYLPLWGSFCVLFPNAAKEAGIIGAADPMPRIAKKKREVIATWDMFDCYPRPRFAALTNLLRRKRLDGTPIVRAVYTYP